MDDPWGSPWAEEDTTAPPAINGVELRAPVTPERSSRSNRDGKSPWDDVVKFGEWTTLPDAEDAAVVLTQAVPDATLENGDVPSNKELVQRTEEYSGDGQLRWQDGDDGALVSENAGLQIPKLSAGQSSPDPWAVEDSKDNEDVGRSETARVSHIEGSLSKDDITGEVAIDLSNWHPEDKPRLRHVRTGLQASSVTEIETPLHGKPISLQEPDPSVALGEEGVSLDRNSQNVQGESSVSRPSSSPSDQSHHEEVLAESPRTSFEDEEKQPKSAKNVPIITRPAVNDKPRDIGEDTQLQDNRVATPKGSHAEDDFGDFEEGISNSVIKEGLHKQTENNESRDSLQRSIDHDTLALPDKKQESSVGSSSKSVDIHESVVFQPDLLRISQLFGEEPIGPETSHPISDEVPDLDIFRDSFSSTEQRKTWYRISRFGPMRKHNAGDEDNYLRINWKDSNIRKNTLQIVARWREEDISGGVILGGGGRPTSIFGWGQKNAAPMSIAAALASKRGSPAIGTEHPTFEIFPKVSDPVPLSMQDSPRNSIESVFSSKNTKQSPTLGNAPQFSWSTGTPVSVTAESDWNRLSPQDAQSQKFPKLELLQAPRTMVTVNPGEFTTVSATDSIEKNAHTSQRPAFAITPFPALRVEPRNVTATPTDPAAPNMDEDDGWGEMVSTPSLAAPSFITPAGSGHQPLTGLQMTIGSTSESAFAPIKPAHGPDVQPYMSTLTSDFESGISITSTLKEIPHKPDTGKPMSPVAGVGLATDFSFFDAPVAPLPTMRQAFPRTVTKIHKPDESLTYSQGESKEEMEQITLVKSIVKNLPDLSYMLRR